MTLARELVDPATGLGGNLYKQQPTVLHNTHSYSQPPYLKTRPLTQDAGLTASWRDALCRPIARRDSAANTVALGEIGRPRPTVRANRFRTAQRHPCGLSGFGKNPARPVSVTCRSTTDYAQRVMTFVNKGDNLLQ